MMIAIACSIVVAFLALAATVSGNAVEEHQSAPIGGKTGQQDVSFPFMHMIPGSANGAESDFLSKPQEQLNSDFAKHFKQLDADFASRFRDSTGQKNRGIVDGMASTEVVFGKSCPPSMHNFNSDEPYNQQSGLGGFTSCDSWTRPDFDKYADSFKSKLPEARLSELHWKYCDLLHRSQQAQEWPEYNRKICRLMQSFRATVASEDVLSPSEQSTADIVAGASSFVEFSAATPSAAAKPTGLGTHYWGRILLGCGITYFFFPSFSLFLISAALMRLKTIPQQAESVFHRLDEALDKNAASEPIYIPIPSIGSVWRKLKAIPQSGFHHLDGSLEMNGASEPTESEVL